MSDNLRDRKLATRATRGGYPLEVDEQLVNPPVARASTILYTTVDEYVNRHDRFLDGVMYGGYGTSTTLALAQSVATLEEAAHTVITSSGTSAIAHSIASVLTHGDHILVADTVYGPTRRFVLSLEEFAGVTATFFNPGIGLSLSALARANTKAVFLEAPGSATFEMIDVPAVVDAARSINAVTLMDNSWATPCCFQPLSHGVDVSIQSGSKYLSGHSDVVIGTVSVNDGVLYRAIKQSQARWGDHASADDCYLALRGLRTLPLRLERHHATAMALVQWLERQPEVKRVLYPAVEGDPSYDLWRRDFSGASGLFGVVVDALSDESRDALFNGCELFKLGSSWGGFESLLVPAAPAPVRTCSTAPFDGDLLRIHAGLEDPEDLIADLEAAFERMRAARGRRQAGGEP